MEVSLYDIDTDQKNNLISFKYDPDSTAFTNNNDLSFLQTDTGVYQILM